MRRYGIWALLAIFGFLGAAIAAMFAVDAHGRQTEANDEMARLAKLAADPASRIYFSRDGGVESIEVVGGGRYSYYFDATIRSNGTDTTVYVGRRKTFASTKPLAVLKRAGFAQPNAFSNTTPWFDLGCGL